MVHPFAKEWPRTVVHNVMIADSRSILYCSYYTNLEGILSGTAISSHCSRMYLECRASLSISFEWSLSEDWALTLDTCKWPRTTAYYHLNSFKQLITSQRLVQPQYYYTESRILSVPSVAMIVSGIFVVGGSVSHPRSV